ncbi:MAG: PQQ-binding-like beta-propeller repeat protein [Flavobacteriaceae bacterium]|nr:PQQ-binding-like beta-propeller repeat protein [Flavobacteriaceae bacterium]
MKNHKLSIVLFGLLLLINSCFKKSEKTSNIDYTKWEEYQGGPDRNQYSTLNQITLENVKNLKPAWSHSLSDSGQMQMNPIIVDGILYGIGPDVRPFALNATTGEEIWTYGDPLKAWHSTSRGVTYWSNGEEDKRIYYGMGSHLYAIDALTGELIEDFADNGRMDLHKGLPEIAREKFLISNAPGTIYKNLIIVPLRMSEGSDAAPGDIRAFNVLTGEMVWTFHTIPYPGEEGYKTWENKDAYKNINVGAVNNWCGMTIDRENGILYVPLGSASPDFYGGNRLGGNLYSDCLVALNVETGEKLWHFQFTHHDIWDRDLPSTPNLIEVERDGKKINAIAQITKQGYVYVFDRFSGEPLFDIEEVPVPESTLIGEKSWETQPIPVKPDPFARSSEALTEDDISPYAENRQELLQIFRNADRRFFAPPSENPVLLLPGYDGGAEWGGAAADPKDGIIYINSNEMAWLLTVEKTENRSSEKLTIGKQLYLNHCATCHQKDRSGIPESRTPSLINIEQKYEKLALMKHIDKGKGMMPGFPNLTSQVKESIAEFLLNLESDKQEITTDYSAYYDPYRHTGYHKFLDSNGLPALTPPWGTLNAINLNNGEYLWKIPLGETPELKEKGFPTTGTENYGGPVVTKNGLLFIAGTTDGIFRAFNKQTGELLWEYQLPAPAFATPSIYESDGKQFIVIACGGEKLGTPKGNQIVAFSL